MFGDDMSPLKFSFLFDGPHHCGCVAVVFLTLTLAVAEMVNGCEYDQFCRWLKVDALVCTIQYSIT